MKFKDIIDNSTPPITIVVSSCLLGVNCNYEGVNNFSELVSELKNNPDKVKIISFCPEESVLGTPREPMNIHHGDGSKVLAGEAKVLTHSGVDITDTMIEGAQKLLKLIKDNDIQLAILKEGSPSCGSTKVFRGEVWPQKEFLTGVGVSSALLIENGVYVISEEMEKELKQLIDLLA